MEARRHSKLYYSKKGFSRALRVSGVNRNPMKVPGAWVDGPEWIGLPFRGGNGCVQWRQCVVKCTNFLLRGSPLWPLSACTSPASQRGAGLLEACSSIMPGSRPRFSIQQDRASGRGKPMPATATRMVHSIWENYFGIGEGGSGPQADPAAAGAVAEEVEEDEEDEEQQQGDALETALAGGSSGAGKKKPKAAAAKSNAPAKSKKAQVRQLLCGAHEIYSAVCALLIMA